MKLHLAISTCPNDTFIFDALVNGRIDTNGLAFDLFMTDIEVLNALAEKGEPDVVKISYAAYPWVSHNYQLIDSGSALGKGVGPLVVSKHDMQLSDLPNASIAIPGERTTANLLFSKFFPGNRRKKVVLFSQIEEAVASGQFHAGLLIHEGRFTYHRKGLRCLADLGEMWEAATRLPIPLGGIAVRRSLPQQTKLLVESLVRQSIQLAMANPRQPIDFVKHHAQEMEPEVMRQHIELYVNNHSVALGLEGREAIEELWSGGVHTEGIPKIVEPIFLQKD